MKKHVCEKSAHHTAVARGEAFLHTQQGGAPNICQQLHSQTAEQVRRNRTILKCITEVLVMMGKQNIAIRGHQEEDSNFMAMLSVLAKENSVLRNHLENAPRISKYRSPDIQKEIIFFSAKQILDGIIDNCKKSVIYALIADESTDVTNKEQISICIRFVSRKEDGKVKHFIREEFLTFVHADKGTNAEELTTKFLETIQSVGLSVNDMRAQGYDGASVMSGHVSGVQTRIRQVNPNAVYVHCRPHVLNLCIVHASKLPLVRNIMDTMQEVTLAFKFSAKRLLVFKEQLGDNPHATEEMGRRSKLKLLCETRWASRADCLSVFVDAFKVLIDIHNLNDSPSSMS